MATSLTRQLAHIRAHSTNALDLKAQKRAHSKSLLFDAHHAATQDYDTLFQVCYEGWQELCRLDARFTDFAVNLFNEQSKLEDRTQMTAAQNQRLDDVLEDFMRLVGSRLLLKPALKAIEWLVRRFRIHEYNVNCLVLTFLPYHTSPIFSALLTILPERRPAAFKFLQPYIQSSASPPRHTIVYTVAHSQELFNNLNTYTLKVCRCEQQYPAFISFWSSIISEAVSLMLSQSRFGNLELQKQNQEDVVRRIMPFLADGLVMEHAPDLRIGCYMILTILSSKCSMSDELLAAAMDMVVYKWNAVTHAGLISLVLLAQQRKLSKLPKMTFQALIAMKNLVDDLLLLKDQYNVEKLVQGLILGLLKRLGRVGDADRLRLIRVLLEANLMQSRLVAAVLAPMLRLTQGANSFRGFHGDFDTQSALADLILCLADSQTVGPVVKLALGDLGDDVRQLGFDIIRATGVIAENPVQPEADVDMEDVNGPSTTADFDALTGQLPAQTAFEMSLLTHSNSFIFMKLLDAFQAASRSQEHLDTFSNLSVLRKSLALKEPLYTSFFIRVWCGSHPLSVRVAAIKALSDYFGAEKLSADVQVLLPYILHALADPSNLIRQAAAELLLTLALSYRTVGSQSGDHSKLPVLGKGQIYGQGKESEDLAWLPWQTVVSLVQDWLIPHLEEFRLNADHIKSSLAEGFYALAERKETNSGPQNLKKSIRASILAWLCSHVLNTPIYAVKDRLLPVLTRVLKVGHVNTVTLLTPMLAATLSQGQGHVENICIKEHIDVSNYIDRVMEIAKPEDKESMKLLQTYIVNSKATADPLLLVAAFRRLSNVWSLLNPQMQVALGGTMLELATSSHDFGEADVKQKEATSVLHTVKLSTDTLQTFLQDCPTLSDSGHKRNAKRRRTICPLQTSENDIRKLCFVIELIDSSATEANFPLVGTLFKKLADLQGHKYRSGTELHYIELLIMSSLRTILEGAANVRLERNEVRVDVLIDCVRTSSDPQVQQNALLLVSTLASIAPELILHDVMPIFTFMGSSIVKRTDDYSAYVVTQTMDSVIPRIMDSLRKRHKDSMMGVSELLISFVAAFDHIPRDRRLTLFRSLVEMIGPDEFLFALLILLHYKLPSSGGALQFSVALLDFYEVETQLETLERYLNTITDSLSIKPTFAAYLLPNDLSENSEVLVADLLSHLVFLIENKHLATKLSNVFAHDATSSERVRPILSNITNQILSLSRRFSQTPEVNNLCQNLLAIILGGLPMIDLIPTLQNLLNDVDVETCLDTLNVFEIRLQESKLTSTAGHEACLNFLPKLSSILQTSEDARVRRIALVCIDHIVERFGKKNVDAVVEATNAVSGVRCLGATSEDLRTTSLLCLSTIVQVLQDEFIPFAPRTLPEALNHLSNQLEAGRCSKRHHNAAFSFFSALLLYTPWTAVGPTLDLLLKVSHGSANADMDEDCFTERRATLDLIAKQIEPAECCAALERTWGNAMAEGPEALKEQLFVLENLLGRLSKSTISHQTETFIRLLTKAFDLRRIQLAPRTEDSYEDEEIEDVEDAANNAAIALVTKINDTIFRPIFVQLVGWAASSSPVAKTHRQISIYKFFIQFFERFKSIVTNYAALIIEDIVEILQSPIPTDENSKILWQKIMQMLQQCFKHDQDGFWQSPRHFDPVSERLLDQLKHVDEPSTIDQLIFCITELAVAADSAAHHKTLNSTTLGYTRSDNSAVRLAAVQCQQSLTTRLGEEWLALLPEMLPFISELQEDDDERVERETLIWIKKIEDALGESLTPMLQ